MEYLNVLVNLPFTKIIIIIIIIIIPYQYPSNYVIIIIIIIITTHQIMFVCRGVGVGGGFSVFTLSIRMSVRYILVSASCLAGVSN